MRNFVRFCLRCMFRLFKVRFEMRFDLRDLPNKGVYISNHVSYVDPIILFAFLPGNPIFALHGQLYRNIWVRFFMRKADVMEYGNLDVPDLKNLIAKVDAGRLCVIFPEGRMTTNGNIMKIYESAGLIADKTNSPIIPIWINGLQYCRFFSKTGGRLPHWYFPRVKIIVEKPRPLKLKDNLRHVRNHISNEIYMIMRQMMFESMYNPKMTVFTQLIKAAKIHAKKCFGLIRPKVLEDIGRKPKSFKDIMLGSYVLGRYFNKTSVYQESIGVMLPNSVAAVCTFFGLNAYGQVPVMLNFSAGAQNIVSGINTTLVKKVITSKLFVKKAGLEEVVKAIEENGTEVIYLEEVAKKISLPAKLLALLQYKVRYVPYKATPDDRAVILFTSGSEGAPKAVVLSNRNVISNVWQIASFETLNRTDVVLNSMPLFHSFGLVLGTLYALYQGAKVFLYPSPLHFRVISDLLYELNATVMIGTDTFFRSYAKIAHPLDFGSLRLCYAGAEGVKLDTRNLLNERLGARLMEAYGTTECSPAVAGNNMVFNKFGTIGKLCPGMECRLEKVDGIDEGGELVVKGPNVMAGYIMADNPGVLVEPHNGWYHTGDVVEIDDIGFIKIKDRIKRFAKIGGEMVSLKAVENMICKAFEGKDEFCCGVVAIPHENKGEQIVVVTNEPTLTSDMLHDFIRKNGYPELYMPRVILYKDKIPTSGTGKVDNVTLKKEVLAELSKQAA
ncbi:MAG: AMP-binding protein [Alphaproteobacteria bacterium]|nr:AMP-binding protein [Alphaproteobacteria bacterium]